MSKIDARGMSCPQPVIQTKKAVEAGANEIEILVDNNTAQNNVTRFLKNSGFGTIRYEQRGEDTAVIARK